MPFEHRIFFPIQPSTQPAEQQEAIRSQLDSSAAAAATRHPFSLFSPPDFRVFDSQASVPQVNGRGGCLSLSDSGVEDRTDVYLLEPQLAGMERFGLKLRGCTAAFLVDPASDDVCTLKLELKLRTKLLEPDASASATASSTTPVVPSAEKWKKVLRAEIRASRRRLFRSIADTLRPLKNEYKNKAQVLQLLFQLQPLLERSAEAEEEASQSEAAAAAASPVLPSLGFHFMLVSKRRQRLRSLNAEQTDMEVRWVGHSGADSQTSSAVAAASPPPLHFRSICFEGDQSAMSDPRITRLFQHLLADGSGAAAGAQASSSGDALGPMVCGYPQFLLRVLQLQHEQMQQERG